MTRTLTAQTTIEVPCSHPPHDHPPDHFDPAGCDGGTLDITVTPGQYVVLVRLEAS